MKESATEREIRSLKPVADRVVDATRCEPASVVAQAVAGLGLYPLELDRLVDVAVGGEYGSEGKGHVCSYLASDYDMLVRVGGPNAGHKAALPPREVPITYVHLPSGSAANPKPGSSSEPVQRSGSHDFSKKFPTSVWPPIGFRSTHRR